MKKATRTLETSKSGKSVKFEIVVDRGVIDMADRSEGFSGHLKAYEQEEIKVYVDGKLFVKGDFRDYRNASIPANLPQGAVAMIGNKMLLSAEMAEIISNLLAEARAEAAADADYVKLTAAKAEKKAEAEKKEAARIVAAFEAGKCLRSGAEAEQYNNIHNEGGDGYVPDVITAEMYQSAKNVLKGA